MTILNKNLETRETWAQTKTTPGSRFSHPDKIKKPYLGVARERRGAKI